MPIGDRIKELRLRRKESLQQLADAIGASKAHIWEIEAGRSRNPSLELLQNLAKHFQTTIAYLVEEPSKDVAPAQLFYRRNEQHLATLSEADLAFVEDMVRKLQK